MLKLQRGTIVFWLEDARPWWVIEWQENNGSGCYWLVNADGDNATATEYEISLIPKTIKL
jgi:hypothetical protein